MKELSWSERISLVRDAFRRVYPSSSEVQPVESSPTWWVDEVFEDHVIVTSDGVAYSVPFTVGDEGVVAFAPSDEWVKVEREWVEAQMGELVSLADFAEAGDVIPVQIARAGKFTEKHGREVEITDADLDTYVANFEAGTAGQELPIFQGHPSPSVRGESPATAWYKRLYTKVVGGVKTLWADIELSDLGRDLIAKKLYKYFSPSIDLETLVITGGGFVNLPAIKGMAAMELSESVFLQEVQTMTFAEKVKQALRELVRREPELLAEFSQEITETGGEDEMTDEERKALEAQIRADVEAEFAQQQKQLADLTEGIRAEVRQQVEAELAEKAALTADLAEFAREVCENGLSTPPDAVTAFLADLSEELRETAKVMLTAKVVDFSERGHGGGGARVKQLPDAMKIALSQFVEGKAEVKAAVERFFAANDLDVAEFDLSEFLPKE